MKGGDVGLLPAHVQLAYGINEKANTPPPQQHPLTTLDTSMRLLSPLLSPLPLFCALHLSPAILVLVHVPFALHSIRLNE